ncbi:MAG: Ig-like domain-containing protein [Aeromicrobium sp.]
MNASLTRRRVAAAAASLAVVAGPLVAGSVGATSVGAPARTAATAVDTTYLTDTFKTATSALPAANVLETVTYDRFQWLLQQPGQFAFIVGSADDDAFKNEVVAAEAAARTAGAKKVYWFDPNLSGQTGVKALNTRDITGINLDAASQAIFGRTWQNVLGQYLGNGIKAVPGSTSQTATTVTVTADDTVVNDATNPLWDYRTGQTAAAGANDDLFFVYDKDNKAGAANDKIRSWVNLTTSTTVPASVTTALTDGGGAAGIDQLSQFAWWKDAANGKHKASYNDVARWGGDILTDADNADGFRVQQLTYPELLHLLDIKDSTDKNFVILFGGTWCHNTRAVIKHVNAEAQENNTTVYNFDLVLDGGTVNGTNGGGNPIHVRDNANSGTTKNFRPSYLYGDVVRTYFKNLVTEYDPNAGGGSRVAYYPGGDLNAVADVVRKLQVPFVINYQRGTGNSPASNAVKRQWIQQNTDASTGLPTFKEYMTEWWFTQPSAQLGLSFPINDPNLTDAQKGQVDVARANVAFAQEGLAKLDDFFGGLPGAVVSTQTVTAPTVAYGATPQVNVAIANKYGRIPAGNATLTVGGQTYTVPVAQNAAAFDLAKLAPGSYNYAVGYAGDAQIVGFQKAGSLTVTKGAVKKASGAVMKAPTSKKAGTYKVTVQAPSGLVKATGGKVTVTLKKGSASKKVTGTLKNGVVTVKVPKLAKGTWKVTVAYAGDGTYVKATGTGTSVKVKK